MFQSHFRISHINNNLYLLTDNHNDIIYDQLKNGYEVNSIINFMKSRRTLKEWLQTDYFKQLEYEIRKEYNYELIWTHGQNTFIHRYLLFDFGKYLNKNKAWKLKDLIFSSNDEAVNRIRESYQISEEYYLKRLSKYEH